MSKKTTLILSFSLLWALPNKSFAQFPSSLLNRPIRSVFDENFWKEFENGMENLFNGTGFGFSVHMEKNRIVLTQDVPGLSKEDIQIDVEDGTTLVIKGATNENTSQKEKEHASYYHSKRSFYKTLPLPEGLNTDHISAEVKNGVLTVILPYQAIKPKSLRRVIVK